MSEGKLIYVADDDPDTCMFCKTVLEGSGYSVDTYLDTPSALAAVRAKCPDLLILDVMIEQADSGFQIAKALGPEFPGLSILLLSSIADGTRQVFDIRGLPIVGMLAKPIEPNVLLRRVERLLERPKG